MCFEHFHHQPGLSDGDFGHQHLGGGDAHEQDSKQVFDENPLMF